MSSLLILSGLVYPVTLLRKRISEASRQVISLCVVSYVSGDLNARVGNLPIPDVVGIFGEDCVSRNGKTLREFISFNYFKIVKKFSEKKKEIHKYTWSARGSKTIINYI